MFGYAQRGRILTLDCHLSKNSGLPSQGKLMLMPRCGNGSGSRFLVRHGFRQAEYYNRLEPSSIIHLVCRDSDVQACDTGRGAESGDSPTCSGGSSGSSQLFLVPEAQGYDTLLPNTRSQQKGTG
jgi:hypothetical protein